MTQKERLLNALGAKAVDRTPFICPGGMMTMIVTDVMDAVGCSWPEAHADSLKMAQLTLGANRLAGIENVGLPFCMTVEAEAMGAQIELGHRESEPRVTRYAIERLGEIDLLTPIDLTRGGPKSASTRSAFSKKRLPRFRSLPTSSVRSALRPPWSIRFCIIVRCAGIRKPPID